MAVFRDGSFEYYEAKPLELSNFTTLAGQFSTFYSPSIQSF
jgi:hypothetical protein